jgi:hypothetical protein
MKADRDGTLYREGNQTKTSRRCLARVQELRGVKTRQRTRCAQSVNGTDNIFRRDDQNDSNRVNRRFLHELW